MKSRKAVLKLIFKYFSLLATEWWEISSGYDKQRDTWKLSSHTLSLKVAEEPTR